MEASVLTLILRLGRPTIEAVPSNPAAVAALPASGAGCPSDTLVYVALSAPSFATTALDATVPEVSSSGQYEPGRRSSTWLRYCEAGCWSYPYVVHAVVVPGGQTDRSWSPVYPYVHVRVSVPPAVSGYVTTTVDTAPCASYRSVAFASTRSDQPAPNAPDVRGSRELKLRTIDRSGPTVATSASVDEVV